MGENRKLVNFIIRRQAAKQKPLSRKALEELHSVLRRSAERAERQNRTEQHRALMRELVDIEAELAMPSYADPPFACPPETK